ncbi:katanin p80 WD40 repeat-containing subunit B1 homolog KTN80.1-like isoform X2 [Hibiscus syriacus]|uniref:katanin p80 WD40 repeat-containing subunit B1 homolog KTN80.1-like isoform X2 n=1 Tax=Hibiscus syriacus TaxID=106335 RepID=UPI001920E444|nr:katanin p80 WD40 repeat-containing subunit B1 homolog KTN80.1-like isoform X2 [Hibiscus syriacus]
MAKRGYKLQEFVAHTGNVNCLNMGKKTCRLLITGGDDHKVNVWSIGKPSSLMSLCGHTSPVESLAFDSAEVLVLAGSSTGGIKLWDLEETKMIRGLTGHRSNCTALEFHPFGEFFASGSMDTNLKVWDIRKKGCIHTYKDHTGGISTIRFTPDGRWVVSGGFDNVVKVWDLTAGKLLNEFKFHEGHIRTIDFHPLEFLLATGSADRTVNFWDLETFELIGSTRSEATGLRSIAFHPDGRTLFCGADDGLKVYSWEPVVFHDSVDMGWSTLGDLCINESKLLGCSHYRNTVGIWAADVEHIEPYGRNYQTEKKFSLERSYSSVEVGSVMRSTLRSRPFSPDCETKEIKNIYIDTAGSNHIATRKDGTFNSPKKVSLPVDACERSNLETEKPSPGTEVNAKSNGQSGKKSFTTPSVVPRENPIVKDSNNSAKEPITFSRTKPGMLLKPAHVRRPSVNKFKVEKLSVTVEPGTLSSIKSGLDSEKDMNSQTRLVSEDGARKSCDEKDSNIKNVIEKSENVSSTLSPPNQETCDESPTSIKDSNSVKIVRGVAVVSGRTRTLVEKFERRERLNSSDDPVTNSTPPMVPETDGIPAMKKTETQISETKSVSANDVIQSGSQISRMESTSSCEESIIDIQISRGEATPASDRLVTGDQISRGELTFTPDRIITGNQTSRQGSTIIPERIIIGNQISRRESNLASSDIITGNQFSRRESNSASSGAITGNQLSRSKSTSSYNVIITGNQTRSSRNQLSRREATSANDRSGPNGTITDNQISRRGLNSATDENVTIVESQITKGTSFASDDGNITESIMQTHDIFLSTLRSRLTKLQVVRHFWEKNDIKGAVGVLRKLPDHSVQADVIGVLMEKMEILTLDLFSGLLPVLMGLLDSKTERHVNISLDMLLKLVAVFGPMIRSIVSAPRVVGVDLHAEQRRDCCNQCFMQLQKIQRLLPPLVRRGGMIARCAQELILVLQE